LFKAAAKVDINWAYPKQPSAKFQFYGHRLLACKCKGLQNFGGTWGGKLN